MADAVQRPYGYLIKLEIRYWTGMVQIMPTVISELLKDGGHSVDDRGIRAQKNLAANATAELRDIVHLAQAWLKKHTPPFPMEDVYIVPLHDLDYVVMKLCDFQQIYYRKVDEFMAKFDDLRATARERLGPLYSDRDWPPHLRNKFYFGWHYVAIAPPDRVHLLSPEVLKQEQEKFKNTIEKAAQQAVAMLRIRFAECLDHIVERLTDTANGTKQTYFYDGYTNVLRKLLNEFRNLNITCDEDLERLIDIAHNTVSSAEIKKLGTDDGVASHIAKAMEQIQAMVDDMMVTKPVRVIRPTSVGPDGPSSETEVAKTS